MTKTKLEAVLGNYKAMKALQQSIKTVLTDGYKKWNKDVVLKMSKSLEECAVSTHQIIESMLNEEN